MLGVSSITNPTDRDFYHDFAGQNILVKAGATVQLPESAARDSAYHLSQRILKEKGLPFFGLEHESCINQLLGIEEPTYFGSADPEEEEASQNATGEDQPESSTPAKQAPRGFMKNKAK